MWHGLIVELCQNRTVISLSKRELIFLHLHTPLLPAIVPVISQHLNWIFWRWFWRGWDKAPPLEGNLPTPSSCSVLFSTVLLFFLLQALLSFACPIAIKGSEETYFQQWRPQTTLVSCHTAAPAVGWAACSRVFMKRHWPAPSAELSDLHRFLALLPGNGTDRDPGTHTRTKRMPLRVLSSPAPILIGLWIRPSSVIHILDFVFCWLPVFIFSAFIQRLCSYKVADFSTVTTELLTKEILQLECTCTPLFNSPQIWKKDFLTSCCPFPYISANRAFPPNARVKTYPVVLTRCTCKPTWLCVRIN